MDVRHLYALFYVSTLHSRNTLCKLTFLQKAFESLAKTTAYESQCLFKLMCGMAQLWEIHCKGLLNREQQLQMSLQSISQVHNQENQARLC